MQVIKRVTLAEVPSASAMELVGELAYVVGDDSANLHIYDRSFKSQAQVPLFDSQYVDRERIPKDKKHDLEASCAFAIDQVEHLFIAGSGSKGQLRDIGFLVSLDKRHAVRDIDLSPLYTTLREMNGLLKGDKLNIEGLAVAADRIVFLHRYSDKSDNLAISCDLNKFIGWIKDPTSQVLPTLHITHFKLPKINGIQAGFSGATTHPNGKSLIVTAAVEDRPDAVEDGAVFGSFIMELTIDTTISELQFPLRYFETKLPGKHGMLKLESPTVLESSATELEIAVVSDDDTGESELVVFKIPR